ASPSNSKQLSAVCLSTGSGGRTNIITKEIDMALGPDGMPESDFTRRCNYLRRIIIGCGKLTFAEVKETNIPWGISGAAKDLLALDLTPDTSRDHKITTVLAAGARPFLQ